MTQESIGFAIREFYPESDTPESAVIDHDANIIGIISGIGPARISEYAIRPIRRVAKAINMILAKNLDDMPVIFQKLQIDEIWMAMLVEGKLTPKKQLIDNLIWYYGINPAYLFYTSNKMWL
jgi:hypothetical protein